jgi:hypothetical protein
MNGRFTRKEGLHAVLDTIAGWACRNDRTVEVTVGGGMLKLGRANRDQQNKIIASRALGPDGHTRSPSRRGSSAAAGCISPPSTLRKTSWAPPRWSRPGC